MLAQKKGGEAVGIDSNSLMNLGGLDNTGAALIKAISDAVGWALKPTQIRRVGKAEMDIEDEQWRRATVRHLYEEKIKQANMESITAQALPQLSDSAKPEEVETDWFSRFFDRCRLVSDEEMQKLWASVLAGEANAPGSYSKRTLTVIADLEKEDALLFKALCGFCVQVMGKKQPLIYEHAGNIYREKGLDFDTLKHLGDIGLINYSPAPSVLEEQKVLRMVYAKHAFRVCSPDKARGNFDVGYVSFTEEGKQLSAFCSDQVCEGFIEYLVETWEKKGYEVKELFAEEDA